MAKHRIVRVNGLLHHLERSCIGLTGLQSRHRSNGMVYPRMQGSVALQCSLPNGLAVASPQVVTHAFASLQFLVVHVREPKMSFAGGVTFCTYRALKFGFFTTTIIRNIFFLEHADPPRARLGPMKNSLRLIVLARQYTQLAKGSRRSAPLLGRPFIIVSNSRRRLTCA